MIKSVLGITILLTYFSSYAQISISSANYNTVSLNETNILQAIVSNSNAATPVKGIVSVKNSAGEIIIEAQTKNFTLNSGINNVSGITIGFTSFVYGTSGKALYLKNNGLIPSGNYSYCFKIIVLNGIEDGDIYCEEFEAATDDFLSLVTPYDKDVLDTKWPVLTWTHSEPFNTLAKNEYYKIVIAEIKKDQSADQAIFANPSIYTKTFVNTHTVPYPQDAKELEDCKRYAWQVQKISNNIIVNKTDVWEFKLADKEQKKDNKYAVLKKNYDAGYYTANNEKIFFQFEEPYNSTHLNKTIYNEKHKKISIEVNNEKNQVKGEEATDIKVQGNNTYEIDLSPYHLKTGFYYLEVLDEKNRKTVLKFYVE